MAEVLVNQTITIKLKEPIEPSRSTSAFAAERSGIFERVWKILGWKK